MNAKNSEYVLLHADREWMKDILFRLKDVLDKDPISVDDINAARWLVKQALKVDRDE